jgi:hypothetical protein
MALTALEGMLFSSTRRIGIDDGTILASEIKRSVQKYLNDNADSPSKRMVFVTNNEQWASLLKEQELAQPDNVILIHEASPCLQGLRMAKFSMHFALWEDVVKKEKLNCAHVRYKSISIAMGIVLLSMATSVFAFRSQETKRNLALRAGEEYALLQKTLKKEYGEKFFALLKKEIKPDYALIFFEFYRRVPFGYAVKGLTINKKSSGDWQVTAEIYPSNPAVKTGHFPKSGIFTNAQVETAVFNNNVGQKITLRKKI